MLLPRNCGRLLIAAQWPKEDSRMEVKLNRLLNEQEAAKYLACSVGLLRKWRLFGGGPKYSKLGRLVRYRDDDLIAFAEQNIVS